MKSKAVLFGLNYDHIPDAKLRGCENDVKNLSGLLTNELNIDCNCYIKKEDTTYDNIVKVLYNLAIDSYKDNLEFAFISYSGHGTYVNDNNGDEKDGKDEGLVPSDFKTKGILIDDILQDIISSFNPNTKIVILVDACHSGTMIDIKYRWVTRNSVTLENIACNIKSRVMYISGCRDDQTSMDALNVSGNEEYTGALTSCFLTAVQKTSDNNIFSILDYTRELLKNKGFEQYPCLSSTYNLYHDVNVFPV